ncbi:MAG: N-acetylneuraminate synthase family protein [Acidobacteriota bacterium]
MQNFPKIIKIGDRLVGEGQPALIIADIGANFDGSLEKAKELAHAVKEGGGDVAKIQSFLAPKIVSGKGFGSMKLKGVHGSWNKPVEQVFEAAEFPREWHAEFISYCRKIGIIGTSSPYDYEAVDLLDEIGVDFYKIGSGDITWLEMLSYIASKGKPMALATGASTLAEVDEAVRTIEQTGNRDLMLMQCITNYPSKISSANLNVLKTYSSAYDIVTGYSDHSPGDVVVLGAIALGAKVIEKHFTLDKSAPGPDHPHSMDPGEFRQMIQRIRSLEAAMGDYRKEVVEEEAETVIVQRRGLYANADIRPGQAITRADVIELRPALGITPQFKSAVIGRTARTQIARGEPIYWNTLA